MPITYSCPKAKEMFAYLAKRFYPLLVSHDEDAICDSLRLFGFRKKKKTIGTAIVFCNDNVVLKIGGIICGEPTRFPNRVVPTAVLCGQYTDFLRIQPRVKIDSASRWKAKRILEKLDEYDVGEDAHSGNVGIYKGKAVVFDW